MVRIEGELIIVISKKTKKYIKVAQIAAAFHLLKELKFKKEIEMHQFHERSKILYPT